MFNGKHDEVLDEVRELRSEFSALRSELALARAETGRLRVEIMRLKVSLKIDSIDEVQTVREAESVATKLLKIERECATTERRLREHVAGG